MSPTEVYSTDASRVTFDLWYTDAYGGVPRYAGHATIPVGELLNSPAGAGSDWGEASLPLRWQPPRGGPRLGCALSVIPSHERDQLDLPVREPAEVLAVADQVIGVLVVSAVRERKADVVQQRHHREIGDGVDQEA